MRTKGKFKDVYQAAKEIYTIPEENQHSPINPVIRMDDEGNWLLVSALEDASDCVFECGLEDFHTIYCDSYDMDYVPSHDDIKSFFDCFDAYSTTEMLKFL